MHLENCKLAPCFVGSFPIANVIHPVTVKLRLPRTIRFHPTFHMSWVKPTLTSRLLRSIRSHPWSMGYCNESSLISYAYIHFSPCSAAIMLRTCANYLVSAYLCLAVYKLCPLSNARLSACLSQRSSVHLIVSDHRVYRPSLPFWLLSFCLAPEWIWRNRIRTSQLLTFCLPKQLHLQPAPYPSLWVQVLFWHVMSCFVFVMFCFQVLGLFHAMFFPCTSLGSSLSPVFVSQLHPITNHLPTVF